MGSARRVFLVIFVVISTGLFAQDRLSAYSSTSDLQPSEKAHAYFSSFIQTLTVHPKELRTLKEISKGLHDSFLKKYEAYSVFDEAFTSGKYDCLTATALFSCALDEMHFSYEIIETNYHIFILVNVNGKDVLIETTDPRNGVITRKSEIEARLESYRKFTPSVANPADYLFQYPFRLYQSISPENLTGLLYYNQAVKAFNNHEWVNCAEFLARSKSLYDSPRCESLKTLLITTLSQSSLSEKIKADCLVRLSGVSANSKISFPGS